MNILYEYFIRISYNIIIIIYVNIIKIQWMVQNYMMQMFQHI